MTRLRRVAFGLPTHHPIFGSESTAPLSVLIQDGGILTVMADEWRIRHKDENLIS